MITKSGAGVEGYCEMPEKPLTPTGTCDGAFDPSEDYKFCYSNGVSQNELLDFKADGTFHRGDSNLTPGVWYYDGCTLIVTIDGPKEFEFIDGTDSLAATVGANTWTITKSGAGIAGYCEVPEPLTPRGTCDGAFDPSEDYKFCYSDGVT